MTLPTKIKDIISWGKFIASLPKALILSVAVFSGVFVGIKYITPIKTKIEQIPDPHQFRKMVENDSLTIHKLYEMSCKLDRMATKEDLINLEAEIKDNAEAIKRSNKIMLKSAIQEGNKYLIDELLSSDFINPNEKKRYNYTYQT
jgi:hypothetical protein